MKFPIDVEIVGFMLPAHPIFEALAYLVGFHLYRRARASQGDALPDLTRGWIIAAAIFGALAGSKLLFLLDNPALSMERFADPNYWVGGKSVVGGFAGGLFAVELAKWRMGITRSTGDLFAIPMAIGLAIGRIGCFLTGLGDHTHGLPTALPWGIDFGDGIARHPTQLYEIGLLLALAWGLAQWAKREPPPGALFAGFMGSYMAFRLVADAFKPGTPIGGLTAIQWTCVGVLAHYAWGLWGRKLAKPEATP